ncbi:MAG TPA: hypothetical protein VFI31_07500 [Pirellulales bacterium]|nr:hypothetical protein [Pirellulales bacterium]
MDFAKKLVVFGLFVVLAVVVSGLYGTVHDQLSYTVSPEYFTKFKFQQFGLASSPLADRVRAAVIGFLASWWMGVPLGVLVGAAGFIHRDAGQMLRVSLWSMLAALIFTLLFSLGGLIYGYLQTSQIDLADYRGWFIPADVTHLRRFLCVGYMHNSSYLGGALSIVVAWAFHLFVRVRQNQSSTTAASALL